MGEEMLYLKNKEENEKRKKLHKAQRLLPW